MFSSCSSKTTSRILLFVVILVMTCHAVCAAEAHHLQLKDLPSLVGTSELPKSSEVAISPDGNWVAYTVTTIPLATAERKQRLWVQPFEGGETTQIGPPDADNSGPTWSPDSRKLLFHTSSGDRHSVAIWNVADKQTRVMNVTPRVPAQWLPDCNRFIVGIIGEEHDPGHNSRFK